MKASTKWLLGILIAVIIIGAGFFAWQKFGWKTYKNTNYGFSLKFDKNWTGYQINEMNLSEPYKSNAIKNPTSEVDYITVMVPQKNVFSEEMLKDPLAGPNLGTEIVAFVVMTPIQWKNYQNGKSEQQNKLTLVGETKNYVISSRIAPYGDINTSDNGKKFYSTYIPNLIKSFQKID